jgi:hypothetical protein
MIGVALAAVVVGLVLIFVLPWVGVPVAIVGALLLLFFLVGFVRRTGEDARSAR